MRKSTIKTHERQVPFMHQPTISTMGSIMIFGPFRNQPYTTKSLFICRAPHSSDYLSATDFGEAFTSTSMGNCSALGKEIKIVKAEGKVVEYRTALKVQKVKVSLLDQQIEDHKEAGPLRVKLIISRRELRQMLLKGAVSVGDRGSPLLEREQTLQTVNIDDSGHCKGWKPILESIPEVD